MSSKRKTRNSRKLQTVAQQIETVLAAIRKAGGCVWTFFKKAAETLSASHFKHEREATKFARVVQDGLDKHRGFKVARVALDYAQQLLMPPDSAAAKGHDKGPAPVMRRAPAVA